MTIYHFLTLAIVGYLIYLQFFLGEKDETH